MLLTSSVSASISALQMNAKAQATGTTSNLNQYEWPQFQGDESFTRFSAGPAPSTSNVLWKATIPGIQPDLTAFDGLIFVGTNTSLVAVNQAGQIAWSTPIPLNKTWPIAYEIDSSHLVAEGSCLDPSTGKILWTSTSFCADTGIFTSNVYSPETKMFYVKDNSYIVAWNFADPSKPPTVAWTTYIPGGGQAGIGTTYGAGIVFAGSFENQQLALNATTGKIIWDTQTKGPMIFDGAYADGFFFRGGTDDNTMYCFNAADGQIVWTYTPPSDPNGYFTTGPAIAYGTVYEMNKDGYLYALNEKTGALLWKYKSPDTDFMWPGMPTVADGKIYLTTGQHAAYNGPAQVSQFACLNAYNGQTIWTLPIEALAPRESAIVAYGNLYIIPGEVTSAVDTTSGTEYSTNNALWAIGGGSSTPAPTPSGTQGSAPTPTPAPSLTPILSSSLSNWTMFRADPAHSSTAEVGPSNLTEAWKFATEGSVVSSPTVVGGVVYAGSQDKNVYAVDALSGKLVWKFATSGSIEDSPAVAAGLLYIESDDGYVYCLNAQSGALNWQTPVGSNLHYTYANLMLTSSPVVSDGMVYIGSLDGNLYALNAESGAIVWKTPSGGPIECSPAYSDGAVFFTSQQPSTGMLFKLNADTGQVMWNFTIPYNHSFLGGTELLGSPSVAAGMVFASSDWGAYYAVNVESGQMVWDFVNPAATEFIVSSPIYVNGDLYIINIFNIMCLNAANGQMVWTAYTGDELYVSPSYADGKIYVATSERHIFVLDTTQGGKKIATGTTPSSSWSSPTIADGMLYIGCNDWNIYCFSEGISTQGSTPATTDNVAMGHDIVIVVFVIAALAIAAAFTVSYVNRKKVKTPSTA